MPLGQLSASPHAFSCIPGESGLRQLDFGVTPASFLLSSLLLMAAGAGANFQNSLALYLFICDLRMMTAPVSE